MLKVGLTGSIAVGKTLVCGIFRELGCHILDADQVARDVVRPGTAGLRAIVEEFGPDVLRPNGELDRKRLGAIVFDNGELRQRLNAIVHPLVRSEQDRWLAELESSVPNAIAIVDAALMIESGGYRRFDKLIVVWCRPEIQLGRLMKRDGLTEAEALNRVEAQMPQNEKKKYADILIDTSGTADETRKQVESAHELLLRLR